MGGIFIPNVENSFFTRITRLFKLLPFGAPVTKEAANQISNNIKQGLANINDSLKAKHVDSNVLPNNSKFVSHSNLNHPEDHLILPDIKPYEGDTSLNQRSPSTLSNLFHSLQRLT